MADGQQLGLSFQAPQRKVYSVRELVSSARTQMERTYGDIYVEGEISNFRPAESGHLYFTLKDGAAQLRVVMWRTQARLLRFRPENGMQVIARGRMTIYDERGELQLQAEYLEPKGAGALQFAFEQLKAKLLAEGLFESSRKKPIPVLPRCIGVVTSPKGAALQDILNILRRRHESVNVLIYPAQVQGESAATENIAGVRYFNRSKNVEVIVIARGGGSLEDLFAYNDEALARIVAASAIPVISAVGHETDVTICDFVADLRAPTPSAAAEIVIRSKHELQEKLLGFHKRMAQTMKYKLLRSHNVLTAAERHPVFLRMRDFVGRRQQRVDELTFRMAHAHGQILKVRAQKLVALADSIRRYDLRIRLATLRQQLAGRTTEMTVAMQQVLALRTLTLERLTIDLNRATESILLRNRNHHQRVHSTLQALSPRAILSRGYALIFDLENNLVKSCDDVSEGSPIRAQIGDGELAAKVTGVFQNRTGK